MLKTLVIAALRAVGTLGLLFVSTAMLVALTRLPVHLDTREAFIPMLAGFGAGILLFAMGWHFLTLYVFGHELTHWLTAKVFRRRTRRFSVRREKGSVEVERPNVWIILAPYFVPLYSLVWMGLWGLVHLVLPQPPPWMIIGFFTGTGLTYAFHVTLTVYALSHGQDDLRHCGVVFSLSLILFCNLLLLFVAATIAGGHWTTAGSVLMRQLCLQWSMVVRAAAWLGARVPR